MLDSLEDRLDSIVFIVGNGIKFVRVTAGTIDREAKKRLPHNSDHIFEFILASDGALCWIRL